MMRRRDEIQRHGFEGDRRYCNINYQALRFMCGDDNVTSED